MAVLGGVGVLALLLVIGLVVSLTGLFASDDSSSPAAGAGSSADTAPPAAVPAVGSGPQAEAALSAQPMISLPDQAALPHALSTRTAGPAITLPLPQQVAGTLVATGFPATPEGAIGQLSELMQVGMAGGDPQVWAQAYASLAEPGAAPAAQTATGRDLVSLRRAANMAPTGPRTGMTISWTPTGAQVKGTTADGSYTVACVLGELVADYNGRVVNGGWGNCLPMRRVDGQWRIASGPTAATAPSAWPGSAEAVAAGWQEIRR
ncbi:hypothetical protein [Pseudonocardia sediminis]|uniref:hypothetical protein n=1 Tax=Pseudonocardia sediminis TaxID=1397368 RepID=UPI001029E124|nr:hypothetical protein [Pseudonocardia sediminis]